MRLTVRYGDEQHFELDLDQSEVISLTKRLLDITQIAKRTTDFSHTFLIPSTPRNDIFLGHWYNVGMEATEFSTDTQTHCDIIEDGVSIFSGNLQLLKYKELEKQYEVVVFGLLNTISNYLGKKLMSELDFSHLVHDHNRTNIELSWAGGLPVGDPGKIIYPIADYGRGYGQWTDLPDGTRGYWNIAQTQHPMYLEDLRPAILLKEMIEVLFKDNGFILNTALFTSSLWDVTYCQLHTDSMTTSITFLPLAIDTLYLGIAAWEVPAVADRVPMETPSPTAWYDNTLYEFDIRIAGEYEFNWRIETGGGQANQDNTLIVYHNATPIWTVTQSQTDSVFIGDITFDAVIGDSVYMTLSTTAARDGNEITSSGNNYFNLLSVRIDSTDLVIYPQAFMTKVTQLDFLKSFLAVFNGVLLGDDSDYLTFEMISWDSYFIGGEVKDWTHKVDYNKSNEIHPMNEILNKEVTLSWADSEDVNNKVYKARTGYNYGTYHSHTGVSYTEGVKSIDVLFMPYLTSATGINWESANLFFAMPKYYNDKDSFAYEDMNFQLFIYSGELDITNLPDSSPWFKYSEGSVDVSTIMTTWPVCQPYTVTKLNAQQWYITEDDFELNFAGNQPLSVWPVFWTDYPDANIYTTWYSKMMTELYAKGNRVLKLNMILTPIDISSFTFRDVIALNYRGTPELWRVQEIQNYNIGKLSDCQVMLTKAYFTGLELTIDPDAQAIINAMPTTPDTLRQELIDDWVVAGKAHGWWDKGRYWNMYAAHAQDSALINWFNPTQSSDEVGAIDFVIDLGYQSSGSEYINTHYIPSSDSANISFDDCYIIDASLTDTGDGSTFLSGVLSVTNFFIRPRNGNIFGARTCDDGAASTTSNTNSRGYFAGGRSGTVGDLYLGKVKTTNVVTGGQLPTDEIFVCCRNSNGVPTNFIQARIPIHGVFRYLTQSEHVHLVDDTNIFLSAIGVLVPAQLPA